MPFGYIANQVGCQNVAIGGTCTITNTATAAAPTNIPSGSTLTMILLGGLLALAGLVAARRFAG